ncbi:hypothetical protein NDN08_008112 [Rhodosorus marinus]|uniref:FAD/NAD(P)-binding domain-containing protein n=2 Tax=Rhodosorus marinus TaxID=101924 RepID=A0AAV8UZF5_9RHOD|nr:hypothetical protein NDN08_008112 [Rhodosorus marinus]
MSIAAARAAKLPKLVVLGTGWGSFSFLKNIDASKFNVSVVSPRDHMLFTPLLASTTVGTLEHRSVIESLRPMAATKGVKFYQGEALTVNPEKRTVTVGKAVLDRFKREHRKLDLSALGEQFTLPYDALVVGVGAVPNTFGIPGVEDNTFFLKEARDGKLIRGRIHDCFEAASYPMEDEDKASVEARKALLTFCVVGGGPTGCEFAAELTDFINQDVGRAYPNAFSGSTHLWPRVILLEASGELLGAFDTSLRSYALRKLHKSGNCEVRLGAAVERVEPGVIVLKGGEKIRCGLVVWSTGIGPRKFVAEGMKWAKRTNGRIEVDDRLQLVDPKGKGRIFAIGDCAQVSGSIYPAIAQVAEQQGNYLAKALNTKGIPDKDIINSQESFRFASKGMLAYLGNYSGVASLVSQDKAGKDVKMKGHIAWLLWRGAYLSKLGTWRNRLQVPVDWAKTLLFGRDPSRF